MNLSRNLCRFKKIRKSTGGFLFRSIYKWLLNSSFALTKHNREEIVEAARKISTEIKSPLSRHEFSRLTGISSYEIYAAFPNGGWREVQKLAGIDQVPGHLPLSDDDLILEFHKVATKIGRIPTWNLVNAEAGVSADTMRKRFGGMYGFLQRYREWLTENHPDSSMLQFLPKTEHETPAPPTEIGDVRKVYDVNDNSQSFGPIFGQPLNFRGLRHAPVNEQGVVLLFGMVSYELGYIVEAVHSEFPDCEAKRRIDPDGRRWQRVRIEFEFVSRNFRDHSHDPKMADLIVCWEHNWPDCPVEVLELKTAIKALQG